MTPKSVMQTTWFLLVALSWIAIVTGICVVIVHFVMKFW